MDIPRAIELIEKTQHIGIIMAPNPDGDSLAAAEVLARSLESQGKTAGFISPLPHLEIPESVQQFFSHISSSSTLPKEFVVSIDTSQTPVAQLRYEKLEDRIEIILSPKSSPIQENSVSFRLGKIQCDLLFTMGIIDIHETESILGLEPGSSQIPFIPISATDENPLSLEDTSSISQHILTLLSQWRPNTLTKEAATLLLSGIINYMETSPLTPLKPDTFTSIAHLIETGGDYARGRTIAHAGKSFALLQLFGRASVRSKLASPQGVLWAFLTAEDFEKTGRTPEDIPRVTNHLETEFSPERAVALLWQDHVTKSIRITLSAPEEAIQKIALHIPGTSEHTSIRADAQFESFQDAEQFLAPLLEQVL